MVVFGALSLPQSLGGVGAEGQFRVDRFHLFDVLLFLKGLEDDGFDAFLGGAGHVVRHALNQALSLISHGFLFLPPLLVEVDCELLWRTVGALL